MAYRRIAVRPLGLTQGEVTALKSVCALSAHATRNLHHHVCVEQESADAYLVDASNPEALQAWSQQDPQHERPAILIGAQELPAGCTAMRRPLLASRLLGALDAMFSRPTEARAAPAAAAEPKPAAAEAKATAASTPQTVSGGVSSRLGVPTTVDAHGHRPPVSVASTSAPPVAAATVASSGRPERFKVLVVDDSTTVRKQLQLALHDMDAMVVAAASGEEALRAVEKYAFDLVLLDVVMPGMDGYQVCKLLKRTRSTRALPVVMLTSKSSPFDKIRGSLAGCDSYLVKPVTHRDFRQVVERYAAFTQAPQTSFPEAAVPGMA
jgi:two-component system, cell cycle response regulator